MTKVKICGITNLEDAVKAVEFGADYIGFLFFEKSRRNITPEQAYEISSKLQGVKKVALFVNEDEEKVRRIAGKVGVDILQFHGDETPEYCEKFKEYWEIWKAFREGRNSNEELLEEIARYASVADAVLLDAYVKGVEGGTGKTCDWDFAAEVRELVENFILAGGLNPSNAAQAIIKVNPYAVDVSSGVEVETRDRKDHEKMRAFIETAKTHSRLLEIVERKKIEIARLYETGDAVKYRREAKKGPNRPSFYEAITAERGITPNLIAEFKITSPSNVRAGNPDYRENAVPEEIVRNYAENGAAAISCLTDSDFKGNLDYLRRISQAVGLPVLRKDFIKDPAQIYETRWFGADAVLLIAVILSKQQIDEYISRAYELGMDCLVEVHDRSELEKVLDTRAKIIGVNNRDLHHPKFHTDINTTLELLRYIPKGKAVVTESGILTYEDVKRLLDPRINAMLVGTTLMKAENIKEKMYELLGR